MCVQRYMASCNFCEYPPLENKELVDALCDYAQCSAQNLLYFNGSDSALDMICRTFLSERDTAIIASPTYDNFRIYAESTGCNILHVYGENLQESCLCKLIQCSDNVKLMYISNPNNPTGLIYTPYEIFQIAQARPDMVLIVDEAYFEFSGVSCVSLITMQTRNIIVVRTMSKAFGLAALRFGYIIADPDIVKNISKIRNPKSVMQVSQLAAHAALNDIESMKAYVRSVTAVKDTIITYLHGENLVYINCQANFILVHCSSGKSFADKMASHGVLVRDRSSQKCLENWVRITMCHMQHKDHLMHALASCVHLILKRL